MALLGILVSRRILRGLAAASTDLPEEKKYLAVPCEEMTLGLVNLALALFAIAFCVRTWVVVLNFIDDQPVRFQVSRPYTGGFTSPAVGTTESTANVVAGPSGARSRVKPSAYMD